MKKRIVLMIGMIVLCHSFTAIGQPMFYPAIRETFTAQSDVEPWISADGLTMYYGIDSNIGSGVDVDVYKATRPTLTSTWSAGSMLPNVNVSASVNSEPWIPSDGLSLYYRVNEPAKLWLASRPNVFSDFSGPVQMTGPINNGYHSFSPSLTADQLTIAFSHRVTSVDDADLYIATRSTVLNAFGTPVALAELNSTGEDQRAHISADGLSIFFESNRSGGSGNFDIYYASRTSTSSSFSTPVNLTTVNTAYYDGGPFLHEPSGHLFFTSNRDTSGETEIYEAISFFIITIDDTSCQAGQVVAIPVRSVGLWSGISTLSFTVQFNPTILDALGAIHPVTATNKYGSTISTSISSNTMTVSLNFSTPPSGNDVPLVDLVFKVSGSAIVGQTTNVEFTSVTNATGQGQGLFTVIQTGWASPWSLYK